MNINMATSLVFYCFLLLVIPSCQNNSWKDLVQSPSHDTTAGSLIYDTLISPQENTNMPVIPNYGTNVPKGQLHVLTRYLGDIFTTEGVSISHSGAVVKKDMTTMVINTKDLENRGLYKPITGGGPHIWISKTFSNKIHPWASPNNELVFQMYASMPTVNLTDPYGHTSHSGFSASQAPVTQLSFGFYMKDEGTGQTFAFLVAVYESRGSYQETARANDTQTNFASSPLESSSQYITKDPQSSALQSKPFSAKKLFKVHISRNNLLSVLQDANHGLSTDLSNYRLTMAGVLFELPNYVKNGCNVSMAKVTKLSVYISKD